MNGREERRKWIDKVYQLFHGGKKPHHSFSIEILKCLNSQNGEKIKVGIKSDTKGITFEEE